MKDVDLIVIDKNRLEEQLIAHSYPIKRGFNSEDFGMTNYGFLELVEELAENVVFVKEGGIS